MPWPLSPAVIYKWLFLITNLDPKWYPDFIGGSALKIFLKINFSKFKSALATEVLDVPFNLFSEYET